MGDEPLATDGTGDGRGSEQASNEGVARLAVRRIRHQPFLFVIGIVALLAGLIVSTSGLESHDFRFVVMVVAILVFVAILGYYVLEALRLHTKLKARAVGSKDTDAVSSGSAVVGRVTVEELSGNADLTGAEGKGHAPAQRIEGHVEIKRASGRAKATGVKWGTQDGKDSDD
jgi:hypothetical protein